jgi:hypothetical protein
MIYRVHIAYDTVVQADSTAAAIEEARLVAREEVTEAVNRAIISVDVVNHVKELPKPWDGGCLPWGGDGKTYLREILK